MSFYRDDIRTARKEHKCEVCHGTIKIGEKYHDKAGNEEDLWYQKECEKCQSVIDEYLVASTDWGYCDEYIQEWWRDEKCPECKSYYPECDPKPDCFPNAHLLKECVCEECKNGKCTADDTCDEMTHYCRCENFVTMERTEEK